MKTKLYLFLCILIAVASCKDEVPFEPEKPADDAIILVEDSCSVSYESCELKIKVSSNVDYTVKTPGWIKYKESRSLTERELCFEVNENKELTSRTGIISLWWGDFRREVIVVQSGYDFSVEREALIALYEATDGDHWKNNENWYSDKPLDEWYGVSLDENYRVVDLLLGDNNLVGTIPQSIASLKNLKFLHLYDNQLSGPIPSELGHLSNLTNLYLNRNQLSGSIPSELGNLPKLERLSLDSNQLSGSIPSELGHLSNLTDLDLGSNQLSGSIPSELGNLSNLFSLTLSNNELSGSIPSELGNLSKLNFLYLHTNQLSGSIPSELGNLSKLKFLYLHTNQLSGSIPSELGNLSNLRDLSLGGNYQLSGSIPPELGNLSNLRYLRLWGNQLSGSIPSELGNLANLTELNLNSNQLSGSIPPELGSLSNLTSLDLSGNELSGPIPSELGDLLNLIYTDGVDIMDCILEGNKFDINNITLSAPEFTVKDLNGNIIKSDELYERNKVTILYWWSYKCGYSTAFNKTLIGLQQMYGPNGLDILGLHVDWWDVTEQEIVDYIETKDIPWNNIYHTYGTEANNVKGDTGGVPNVMVIDNNKHIIFSSQLYSRDDLPAFLYEYFQE